MADGLTDEAPRRNAEQALSEAVQVILCFDAFKSFTWS